MGLFCWGLVIPPSSLLLENLSLHFKRNCFNDVLSYSPNNYFFLGKKRNQISVCFKDIKVGTQKLWIKDTKTFPYGSVKNFNKTTDIVHAKEILIFF